MEPFVLQYWPLAIRHRRNHNVNNMLVTNPKWQRQIEDRAGIDEEIAAHINKQKTAAARAAMCALQLCVNRLESGAFGILKAAVDECRRELGR